MSRPDVGRPVGLRDRASLEVLYSTGIRRAVLIGLDLAAANQSAGILAIRQGKGRTARCHLFRHTVAPLMPENGADIRFIQQMLGHAHLSTTEIYTHVAIHKLKSIHEATHPARLPEAVAERVKQARGQGSEQDPDPTPEDVLDALEWEAEDEDEEE